LPAATPQGSVRRARVAEVVRYQLAVWVAGWWWRVETGRELKERAMMSIGRQ
jgi:hypothetical protein